MTHHCEYTDCSFHLCYLCSTKHADSIDLELEVDPLNVDHFSCTPLVSDQYFSMVFWMCLSLHACAWYRSSYGLFRCGLVLWAILRQHWCFISGTQELWLFLIRWDACRSTSPDLGATLDWLSSWSSCNRLLKHRVSLLTLGWTGGEESHRPAE